MAQRKTPEVNAGSMADIAFLLLIFFLVTTTMDTDSGISRKLPPMIDEPNPDSPPIKQRNIFLVMINKNNDLLVEGEPLSITQLKEKAKEFIVNPMNADNLPEKKPTEINFFGTVAVGKGIISLQNDRGTEYQTYLKVQNELVAAYNELRNAKAMSKWQKKYADLTEDQQKAIKKIYPQRISEAEPKSVGGKK